MTWRRFAFIALAGLFVVFIAAAVIVIQGRPADLLTDGRTIHRSAGDAAPRTVLWSPPERLPAPVTPPVGEVFEPHLSADGTVLVYVTGRPGGEADLMLAERGADGWMPPRALAAVNSDDDDLGPALSPDGRTLYFYSDRDGGLGGYDLWMSVRSADGWSAPEPLGANVNSPANEYGPAVSADGATLLFASNRTPAADAGPPPWPATVRESHDVRAYDLYRAAVTERGVGVPEALTALNSPWNEGTPALSPAGDFLWFASDRPGGRGGFDLYRARVHPDGSLGPVVSAGPTLNSSANELDPSLAFAGFRLVFSSDRAGDGEAAAYGIYESTSREVERQGRPWLAGVDWSKLLLLLLWLGLLLLTLLLCWWLTRLARSERFRTLSLLVRCLIGSVLLHFLILLLLTVWGVGNSMSNWLRDGAGTRVVLTSGAPQSDVAAQLFASAIDVDVAPPDTPAPTAPAGELTVPAAEAVARADALLAPSAVADVAPPTLDPAASLAPTNPVPPPAPTATPPDTPLVLPLPAALAASLPLPLPAAPAPAREAQAVAPAPATTPAVPVTAGAPPPVAVAPDVVALAPTALNIPAPVTVERPAVDAASRAARGAPSATPVTPAAAIPHPPTAAPMERAARRASAEPTGPSPDAAADAVAFDPPVDVTAPTNAPMRATDLPTPRPTSGVVADVPVNAAPTPLAESDPVRFTPTPTATAVAAPAAAQTVRLPTPDAPTRTDTVTEATAPSALPALRADADDAPAAPLAAASPDVAPPRRDHVPAPTAVAAGMLAPEEAIREASAAPSIPGTPASVLPSAPTVTAPDAVVVAFEAPAVPPGAPALADATLTEADILRDISPTAVAVPSATPGARDLPAVRANLLTPTALANPAGAPVALVPPPPTVVVPAPTVRTPPGTPVLPAAARAPFAPAAPRAEPPPPTQNADRTEDAAARAALVDASAPDVPTVLPAPAARAEASPARHAPAIEPAALIDPPVPVVRAVSPPVPSAAAVRTAVVPSPATLAPVPPSVLDLPPQPDAAARRFAQRDPERREELLEQLGGSDATERAVAAALEWLARHQDDSGRWDSIGFDDDGGPSRGRARARVDIAVTGLALLCFLAADHTHTEDGPYRDHVRRGIAWLVARQTSDGGLMRNESLYSHGIATIALAEAWGMTGDATLADPVRRAADYITRAANREIGGWRYAPGQAGDTSVLGWQIMALAAAEKAGVPFDPSARASAMRYLGTVRRGPGRYAYQPGRTPSRAMTAEAMLARNLLGDPLPSDERARATSWLLGHRPTWDETSTTYMWYYTTLALFIEHAGAPEGSDASDAWPEWNRRVTDVLLARQIADGPAAGSWAPIDKWSVTGGRIYQTAICCLTLEVYYRYLPRWLAAIEEAAAE